MRLQSAIFQTRGEVKLCLNLHRFWINQFEDLIDTYKINTIKWPFNKIPLTISLGLMFENVGMHGLCYLHMLLKVDDSFNNDLAIVLN